MPLPTATTPQTPLKEKPLSSFRAYARLWKYFKTILWMFIISMTAASLVGIFDALMPLGIKIYLDLVLEHKSLLQVFDGFPLWTKPFTSIVVSFLPAGIDVLKTSWMIPVGIIVFMLTQGAFNYIATYLTVLVNVSLNTQVKRDLYAKLLGFEPAYFDRSNTGDILARFGGDVDMAINGVTDMLKSSLVRTFSVIGLSLTLLSISWKLATIALVVLSTIFIPLAFMRKYLKKVSQTTLENMSLLSSHYTEALQGNRVIAVFHLFNVKLAAFESSIKGLRHIALRLATVQGAITPIMHSISGLGISLVLWFGTGLMQSGEMTTGGFASFLTSLILLYTPIKSLGNMSTQLQLSYLALLRVYELMDRVPTLQFPTTGADLSTIEQGITVKNLSFQYRADLPMVLKHVDLFIPTGKTVALVGSSGSGKTTLAHLLLRLYDAVEGEILFDSHPIQTLTKETLASLSCAVFQDNFMFVGSIRENILLSNPQATETELWQAIDAAYLRDFVNSLPQGLETPVGERGVLLSGGQKQRIAIARAFLKNTPLVVLDEATSALDNQSEAVVQQAIDSLMQNRTVVVIAHRLSTVMNADSIVVMAHGEIVEQGTHAQLLADGGAYANLYNAQFKEPLPVAVPSPTAFATELLAP